MIIIVDVNVVISALIKDSITREIISEFGQDFCFPEISLHKIRKYKDMILEKSALPERDFQVIITTLFQFIRLIPNEELMPYWDEAKKIMARIDSEDVPFIATALSQENSVIWSEDKHFDEQDRVSILKTKDIVDLFHEEE